MRLDAGMSAEIGQPQRKGDLISSRKHGPTKEPENFIIGKSGKYVLLYDPGTDKDVVPFSINEFVPSEDGQKVALRLT